MRGKLLRALTAVALLALTVALAACGSSSSGKNGGTLTVLNQGDFQYVDPGAAYYQFDYMVDLATQKSLYQYKPNERTITPDLAASQPQISSDNKTVTVKIKKGVKFSPPVNREVTSADVKYAIERAFSSSVANGYAGAYFGDVVGAPAKATKGVPNITGIRTPDKRTIVFELKRPDGVFTGSLGLLMTAPVPREYASKFDSQTTSTYGMHQVATGPYMIKNDSSGNINGVGYKPGQLIDLVRNPNWSAKTSWRPAHADEVLFKEGYQDPTVMTRTILSGAADVNGDSPPPPAELRSIMSNSSERAQLHFTPAGGSRYVALNTSKPPFDKLAVRQAVATVLDRNAMRLTRGGAIDGRIATHFIDPSFSRQGFTQAGGLGFDPFPSPGFRGDVAKAKALLRKAGYAGGMFTGPQVTMVADNSPPGANTAQVVAADLAKIGFNVKTISVTHSTMYTKYCNVPKNEPNICPNVGWLPDFHEPQTVLDVTFAGNRITPVNNSNWPLLNDPMINAAIAHAKTILSPTARWAAWGRIDRMVTQSAAAVPWIWENFPSLYSKRVTPAPELWNGGSPDVTFMSVSGS